MWIFWFWWSFYGYVREYPVPKKYTQEYLSIKWWNIPFEQYHLFFISNIPNFALGKTIVSVYGEPDIFSACKVAWVVPNIEQPYGL